MRFVHCIRGDRLIGYAYRRVATRWPPRVDQCTLIIIVVLIQESLNSKNQRLAAKGDRSEAGQPGRQAETR